MLMPFMVATVLLFSSLLVYGAAMRLIVRVVVRLIREWCRRAGYSKTTAVVGHRYGDHRCAPDPDRRVGGGTFF